METIDISWGYLFLGYLMLGIPLWAFWYYHTGLVRDTIVAAARMTVQLILMGLYLTVLFDLNNAWINLLWLLIMIGVGTGTTLRRSELHWRKFLIPVTVGSLISIVIVDAFFLGIVLHLENVFDARYFVTISGMIMGNSMKHNIIALDVFYKTLSRNKSDYKYCIANGATRREALQPFMRQALKISFNPQIATMAVMGLIALPGTLTGQIIGGSSPDTAIKYQILLMLAIFVASMITILITINMANRNLFDKWDDFEKFS
jgi:putative ABC transport system permease protein